MRTPLTKRILAIILWGSTLVVCQASDPAATSPQAVEPDVVTIHRHLAKHCLRCHGLNDQREGDIDLSKFNDRDGLKGQGELLGRMIEAIETRHMPPEGESTLEETPRIELVAALKLGLDWAIASQPSQHRTPLRRMNRFQYNNAVQDLLELTVEVFPLPERVIRPLDNYFQPATGKMPDEVKVVCRPLSKDSKTEPHLRGLTPFPQDLRAEHGFDNRGDHLSLSPILLESFLQLGRSVVESPDFNAKTCGIWKSLYQPPDDSTDEAVDAEVRRRLQGFLEKAFRRPAEEEWVDRYTQFVHRQMTEGASFTEAMKSATAAVIASPRFFYLYDASTNEVAAEDPTGGQSANELNDYDLATRLSMFLWGGIPDQELLDLAKEGQLRQPSQLQQQVRRMLRDRRTKRFCDAFPSQWLQLERIISSEPDPKLFPQFYFYKYRVSMHMMLEPLLLFETVLVENDSILQFIDADFSYRSDLLQAWYRDGTAGERTAPTQVILHRVPVTDRRQGGMITNAAALTMTSGTSRTKPIARGAWLATVILNDPPPPPPADVPPLADKPAPDEAHLSLRDRFIAHRQNPACAGCHQRIDPLGFALENFNAVGVWRDRDDQGEPIDASGKLFGRYEFQDIVGFKDAILQEKDRFTRALAEHLLSYALGRAIHVEDSRSLDRIVSETAAADYRFHALIEQIVLSDSFRR